MKKIVNKVSFFVHRSWVHSFLATAVVAAAAAAATTSGAVLPV